MLEHGMKAHDLARKLLEGPDLPVIINGWGSSEGFAYEVNTTEPEECSFFNSDLSSPAPEMDRLGYPVPRKCIALNHK